MTIRCGLSIEQRPVGVAFPRPKTASGGLRHIPRRRVGRTALQPTGAPWKNRLRYDLARRGAVLPENDQEIVVTGKKDKPKPFDLSKLGSCLGSSALDHYGLGGAAAASGALAVPIPKAIVPPYRVIGSKTTNLLSVLGHFAEVNIPRIEIGGLGSTNLLRVAGRANPYVAAALAAADAVAIGYSTYQCYNSGG